MSNQPDQRPSQVFRKCQVEKHFFNSLNDDAFPLVSNANVKFQVNEQVQELPKSEDCSVSRLKEYISALSEEELDNIMDTGRNEDKEIINKSFRINLRRSGASMKGPNTRGFVGQKLRAGLQQLVAFAKGGATRASTTSHPSLRRGSEASLKCNRPFANRASLDPSFKANLERAVTMSRNMNEQIRAEANIEMLAINERLAMHEREKVELNKKLTALKQAIVNR